MKFKCPACGKILNRDMRGRCEKSFLTKGGKYRSLCGKTDRDVLCVPMLKSRTEPKL